MKTTIESLSKKAIQLEMFFFKASLSMKPWMEVLLPAFSNPILRQPNQLKRRKL